MLHGNIRPDLRGTTERPPVPRDLMCLAMQYALIGHSRSRIYVDAHEFRSYGCGDGNCRHSVIPENIDSKWKQKPCFYFECQRAQKGNSMRRYTRGVEGYIAKVLYH